MAGASAGSGRLKSALLSNLPGLVSAVVLAGGVGYICNYNFFLLFVVFLLLYFVTGTAAEFLIVALHIEKVKHDRKKQSNTVPSGRRTPGKTAEKTAEKQNPSGGDDFFVVEGSAGDAAGAYTQTGEEKNEKEERETPSDAADAGEVLVPNQKAKMQYIVSAKVKIMTSDDLPKKTNEEEES